MTSTGPPTTLEQQLREMNAVLLVSSICQHELTEKAEKAEAAARNSEERYRALFAAAPMGVFVCDTDAVIQHYNAWAVKLWGREPTCGVEKHCGSTKLWRPDGTLLPHAQSPTVEVLRTGIPADNVEVSIERPDGSRLPVLVNFAPLKDARGEITGVITSFVDITERILLERKTQEQAVALADLHRRKDEFLAMLSHELRNPLAPIANAVYLLRAEGDGTRLQQQARSVIERQVGQLTRLVNDLLEVSRITTGQVRLEQERLDMRQVVERAVGTVQPLIDRRKHDLTVSLPAEPVWLHADPSRLEQVVVNLLNNAAKYTEDGGRIAVAVGQEGDEMVLRVRDTGVGIAPELLPRIFDLFTQADRSLDRSQGGLGIGLSLVRGLVEMHRGTVEVTSDGLGRGSEFVVRLPVLLSPAPPATPPEEPAERPAHARRVLVVDDNVDTAESLAELLKLSGHDVRLAHTGPDAVDAAMAFAPEVVLLDIGLPGLNGYEVARRLRANPALTGLRLVAVTGYGRDTDLQLAKEAGFDQHMVKPVDPAKVLALLSAPPTPPKG
jgi:PAS domain S-box-containing protein